MRPVFTYACPVWFNISPSIMESLRKFERSCLRACLGKYYTPESNFTRYFSNQIIYDEANIPRCHNFIIKLTRNHILQCENVENILVNQFYHPAIETMERHLVGGFVPPEAFPLLDARGYIQNNFNEPLLYHRKRHAFKKTFLL